ncbi:hypothetical protein [Sphingomicrobium flavum]|uniref:hypothetical protein n=1 Tax=Sphingomicrobium flavum TaxID=1229164 RepID=UPI0021AD86AD|nr:hypothetical protein [Sphingomicrobium flavum]
MRFIILAMAAFGAMTLAATPAAAQQVIETNKRNWKHDASGIKFPREVAGMRRQRIAAFSSDESNIGIQYDAIDKSSFVTVYLYPYAGGDLSVWFDRASIGLQSRTELFPTMEGGEPTAYVPPGAEVASGLMASWAVGGEHRSTLLALFPVSTGLAKIRVTSSTASREEIEALARSFLSEFSWRYGAMQPAVAVAECADALRFDEAAKLVEKDKDDRMQSGILTALLSSVVQGSLEEKGVVKKPAAYCRDASSEAIFGVYRADGRDDGYLMALSDTGSSISVYRDGMAALLGDGSSKEDEKPEYQINLLEADRTLHYAPMDGLPPPAMALQHVQQTRPISSANKRDKGSNITISTD